MSKSATSDTSHQWFLRIGNGTVFGPVSTQGLIVWAEQGRVAPGNEISEDRETWSPAESLEALCMCWMIQRADGAVQGPFNRQALDGLIKEGKVPPDATLVNRDHPEEVLTVQEAGGPVPLDAGATRASAAAGNHLNNRVLELEVKLERSQESLQKAEEELKRLQLQESVRRRRTAAARPAGMAGPRAMAPDSSQEQAAAPASTDLEALRKELETTRKALNRERSQFKKQMEALQDQMEHTQAVEQNVLPEPQAAPVNVDAHATREAEIQGLKGELEEAHEQIAQAQASAEEARNALTQQQADAEARNAELLSRLEALQAAQEESTRRLSEAEATADLLQEETARIEPLESEKAELQNRLLALQAELADATAPLDAADEDEERARIMDTLRAQLREQQADLDIMRTELEATQRGATQEDLEAYRARVTELEAERTTLRDELASLRALPPVTEPVAEVAFDTERDPRTHDLTSRLDALTLRHEALADEYAQATSQLAELRKSHAPLEQHLRDTRQQLEEERSAHAETLQFANDRDVQLQEEIEGLRRRLDHAESRRMSTGTGDMKALEDELQALRKALREADARTAATPAAAAAAQSGDTERLFQEIVLDEITAVEGSLSDEREGFKELRDSSLKRQEMCQTRIQNLQRLLSGDLGHHRRRLKERDAAVEELRELKKALEEARRESQRMLEKADAREEELQRRLRRAETQGAQQFERLVTAENISDGARDLTDQLQSKSQELSLAQQQLEKERQEWRQTEKALLRRIEELEQGAGSLLLESESAAVSTSGIRLPERQAKQKPHRRDGFQRPPWMSLK